MLDGIYVNQPKRFLPLTKKAKKLAEEFRKEEIASQWAGIPPEKLLQESFVEQLNSLQSLDQLAPSPQQRNIYLKISSIYWNFWEKLITFPLISCTMILHKSYKNSYTSFEE